MFELLERESFDFDAVKLVELVTFNHWVWNIARLWHYYEPHVISHFSSSGSLSHSASRSGSDSGKAAAVYPPRAGGKSESVKYSNSCKVERNNSVQHASALIRRHILVIRHLWVCREMLQCIAAVGLITADQESAARSIGPGARFGTWWVWAERWGGEAEREREGKFGCVEI